MTLQLTKKNTCDQNRGSAVVYGYEPEGIDDYNTTWVLAEFSLGKGGISWRWTKTCTNSFLDFCRTG